VVCPAIDESDSFSATTALAEAERLQAGPFRDVRVAVVHGQLKAADRDEVMRSFKTGEVQVLVSTSLIEVGIDVPNATVMVVEDADRFGLAQLHQLRGRVGRGEHAGYCALITRTEKPETRARLLFLTERPDGSDGFKIAEKDLELRGPGDFLGTRQSGLPALRVAQLTDVETILQARAAAELMFEQDPLLVQFPHLARQVERFWRGHGDVS
jgi:ATP-dependent DNA helicase RecG